MKNVAGVVYLGMTFYCIDASRTPCLAAGGGATATTAGQSTTSASETDSGEASLSEIVVTATRREETVNTVPLSITAYDTAKLDAQGIVSIDDLARLTPGVTFVRSGYANTSEISIRGISSSVGAATTGIYIDDTPVQVRTLGFAAIESLPRKFRFAAR